MKLVDAFDHNKDDKSSQQKLNDHLNEVAVCKNLSAEVSCFLQRNIGLSVQHEHFVSKIDPTCDQRDDGHYDVIDQGIDDVAEGTTDDHTDSHIDHVAAHDEFFEFIDKVVHDILLFLLQILENYSM